MDLCSLWIVYKLFKCLVKSLNDLNSYSSVQLYFPCIQFTVTSVIQIFGYFPHLPGLLFPMFPCLTNLLIFHFLVQISILLKPSLTPDYGALLCAIYTFPYGGMYYSVLQLPGCLSVFPPLLGSYCLAIIETS